MQRRYGPGSLIAKKKKAVKANTHAAGTQNAIERKAAEAPHIDKQQQPRQQLLKHHRLAAGSSCRSFSLFTVNVNHNTGIQLNRPCMALVLAMNDAQHPRDDAGDMQAKLCENDKAP